MQILDFFGACLVPISQLCLIVDSEGRFWHLRVYDKGVFYYLSFFSSLVVDCFSWILCKGIEVGVLDSFSLGDLIRSIIYNMW